MKSCIFWFKASFILVPTVEADYQLTVVILGATVVVSILGCVK